MLGDGNARAVAGLLWDAADVAREQGDLTRAAAHLQASLAPALGLDAAARHC